MAKRWLSRFMRAPQHSTLLPTGQALSLLMMLLALFTTGTGCQQHLRNIKYSAYEKIGIDKRDLVRRRVGDAKEEQEEAREEFKDALERLKELVAFDGGDLERQYNKLNDAYEDSAEEAKEVRSSIEALETVAQDLFREWEREIGEISSGQLKQESRQVLRESQQRYRALRSQLKKAEAQLEPALTQLRDHVLFLKHNLNAQAISALKTESVKIEKQIEQLIQDINQSIRQSEEFMKTLPKT